MIDTSSPLLGVPGAPRPGALARRVAVAVAIAASLASCAGCSGGRQSPDASVADPTPTAVDPGDAAPASATPGAIGGDPVGHGSGVAEVGTPPDGDALYQQLCAFCHGDGGQGYLADHANALANPNFLATASDAFLRDAIVYGRPGTPMSGWGAEVGGPLDAASVDAIVAKIRAWQTTPTVELPPAPPGGSALRGRAAYDTHCAACHGPNGEGVVAVGLANPRFLASASDAYLRYAIEHGRPGTAMAAWGPTLRPQTIDDLVALIRSWETPIEEAPVAELASNLQGAVLNPGGDRPNFRPRDGRYVGVDDVARALRAGKSLIILDARARSDFALGHIDGAANLPFYEAPSLVEQVPRGHWVISYCACPHAVSGQLADALTAAGFADVAVLDEGYYVWRDRGYPVVTPPAAPPPTE